MKTLLLATIILNLGYTTLADPDYDRGFIAYEAGDYATALREWRPLAEQGDAQAQHNLASMYNKGEGVSADDTEAVKWYLLAAEQGVSSAQYNLGNAYRNGEGVNQDYSEAKKWYLLAAEQGHAKPNIIWA